MQRKNWNLLIKGCAFVLILTIQGIAKGQVTFNITAANIKQASLTVDNATTNYTAPAIGLVPTINLKTAASTLSVTGNSNTFAASMFTARIISTAGGSVPVNNSTPVTLSTTNQTIYSSLLSLLSLGSGFITLRYALNGINTTQWFAGNYSTSLQFSLGGIGQGSLNPSSAPLNLNVNAFITATTASAGIQLNINSLSYFRSSAASGTFDITALTTVPYGIRVKSNSSVFTYSNGYSGAANPNTAASQVTANLAMPSVGADNSLSTTLSTLTPNGGLNVPLLNQQTCNTTIRIDPANLKAGFVQQGTYTGALTFETFDAQTTPAAATQTLTCPLTVVVSDMGELIVNQTDINLNYTTGSDYANGIYTDVAGHIKVSKTTPYDVYVKANSATLTNGANSLPLNTITISPTAASAGSFNTVILSATAQKLVSGALPVVDKLLDVRYAIPAANSGALLGKAAGVYTTGITYSLVAP